MTDKAIIKKEFSPPVRILPGDSLELTWKPDSPMVVSAVHVICEPIQPNYTQIFHGEMDDWMEDRSDSATCGHCGNASDLRDHLGNCVACGAPRLAA